MDTTSIRYKVKAKHAEKNKETIRRVFDELGANKPYGLRYVSFRLCDSASFIHVAAVESDDGENPLPGTAAFNSFIADIIDRCEEPPVASSADIVGSYRLFWPKHTDTG